MKMSFPTFNKIIRTINFQNIQARVLLRHRESVARDHAGDGGKSRGNALVRDRPPTTLLPRTTRTTQGNSSHP